MWWTVAASAIGGLAVLFFFGRRSERAVRRDWDLLLTPKGDKLYRTVEARTQTDMALAEIAFDEAFSVRQLGSIDEAARLLDVGYRVIEKFAPDMLRLLAAMATFSRMVSAMAPVAPLRPADFRLAQLASLAQLGRLLHHFLVSTGERFRLRVYILGRSFALATRALFHSTQRILGREGALDREWDQIEAIRGDFQTLTDESLASLKVLLMSLAAERHEDILRRL